jgi:hypothetical protein
MIIFKDWFISFVGAGLLAFSSCVTAGATSALTFNVTPSRIQPGEHAVLEITFSPENPSNEITPVLGDQLLSKVESLQWLGRDSKQEKGKTIWRFEFTSYNVGQVTIPPVEIQYGPENFSTESRRIDISSSRQDGDENIREEYGPVPLPVQWRHLLGLFAKALAVIAFVFVLFAFVRKYWKQRPAPKEEGPVEENPLVWLRGQLEELRTNLQRETPPARPVDELTGLLRTYFAKASQNPVEAWTTGEFRDRFARDEIAQRVGKILERCDELKFGGATKVDQKQATWLAVAESEKILFP